MTPSDRSLHEKCATLVVMGAGVMGQGIARLFANSGMQVTLVDTRDVAIPHPAVTLARQAPRNVSPDLVIEAVFEDFKVKQSVYAEIEKLYQGRSVLATNTSGLPLDELAAPLRFPERFLASTFSAAGGPFPDD